MNELDRIFRAIISENIDRVSNALLLKVIDELSDSMIQGIAEEMKMQYEQVENHFLNARFKLEEQLNKERKKKDADKL